MAAIKTYLLRAVYDWALENGFTPHIVVDTRNPDVRVPSGYADERGRMILNVHPRALNGFVLDDSGVGFSARFDKTSFAIFAPLDSVLAVYARENGQGVSFPAAPETGAPNPDPDDTGSAPRRPSLRVVK